MPETGTIDQTTETAQVTGVVESSSRRGNPKLAEARKLRARKADDPFYIHLTSVMRLVRDRYNLTVVKVMEKSSGEKYLMNEGHFCTVPGVIRYLESCDIRTDDIRKKLEGFRTRYEKGFLKIDIPEGFTFDPKDIQEEQNEEDS